MSGKFIRKKGGDKGVDWQWRRLRSGRRYAKTAMPPSWLEDLLAQATASPSFPCSASSYFLCCKCSEDAEEREPVITFCGHVFCWSCLYRSFVEKGFNGLRGPCPLCESAVDLCPRTKTVCPIYYIKGPQALSDSYHEMEIGEKSEIGSKCKSKIKDNSDSKSEDDYGSTSDSDDDVIIGDGPKIKSEILKERLKKFIKVDPSKRPSDKRPMVHSSFITFTLLNSGSIEETLFFSMRNLFDEWKSAKSELNGIMEKVLFLGEGLSSQLVKRHERGLQPVGGLHVGMPVKTQRTNSLARDVGVDKSTVLSEEINPSPSPSFCSSSSHYFSCNVCYSNATSREPVISYCGHLFCSSCIHENILQSGFLHCPVCKSAIDTSTACPISPNREAGESLTHKLREDWQNALLVLDPSAVQLQIHSMMYELDREIAVHIESFYDTIVEMLHSMDGFCFGMRKHLVDKHICYSTEDQILQHFPKDNIGPVLLKANTKGSNISSILSQVVQTEPSMTSAPSSSSGPRFCCGCCHKHTLNDPVVTYCTHLFCWSCLYLDIKTNGTRGEDGSLHGPCPECKADNIVFSSTTAKLTVIPICKGPESSTEEHQKIEEEYSTGEVPPPPAAKRLSIRELKKMRECVSQTMNMVKHLTDSLESKMDKIAHIIRSAHGIVRRQRHRLLLGLVDGWCWAYFGPRVKGVVGTDDTEARLVGLSRSWLDVVDSDSACTLVNKKEVLGLKAVEFLTS